VRRRGEVVLAVPRPGGRFLLHTKSTYPDNVYRLPGGGINPSEAVEHAARREMGEELGFDLELTRFIGVVENEFLLGDEGLAYPTYVLLTEPTAMVPRVMDPSEPIAGFRDATLEEIREVVRRLLSLPDEWQPWGQFRAEPHAMLLERLDEFKGG
jgi:8-oxo-dGTP pyrophosphatase MutT (NUDIX family)